MEAQLILEVFDEVAAAVRARLDAVIDWGPSGRRDGQYAFDVVADEVALPILERAGFGVLSEESGITAGDRPLLAVIDPVDGSTNAAAGLPWYATSLCAVDGDGPVAALVVNQATGDRWQAVRGGGAHRNGQPIVPAATTELASALIVVSDLPSQHLGWRQYRCYGAAALDICAVADGTFDAFVDLGVDAHGVWDYLGALLICREAGVAVIDAQDRELAVLDPDARRTPVAAATPQLLDEIRDRLREAQPEID